MEAAKAMSLEMTSHVSLCTVTEELWADIGRQMDTKATIATSVISGAVSIVLAVIAGYVTLHSTKNELSEATQQAKQTTVATNEAVARLDRAKAVVSMDSSGVPVGTIVASMLTPAEFASQSGDPKEFDPSVSRWSLADGRDVTRAKFRAAALSDRVPDLRGMFLRGMNVGRRDGKEDPDDKREVGHLQDDELKSHAHPLGFGRHGLQNGKGDVDLEINGSPQESTLAVGGKETRPRNVAVYYYVKIN